MIDSLFVAMSGLQGHQRGLSVISNNVANMNTPGFRGSTVQFADIFFGAPGESPLPGQHGLGGGLSASLTVLDTRAGESQQTARDLDLRLEGAGFFVLRAEDGTILYTRNGSFDLNADGELVTRDQQFKVLTRDASGQLVPVELGGLKNNPAKPTDEVTFSGILSSEDDEHTIEALTVYDRSGGKHTLKLELRNETPTGTFNFAEWTVTVFEGATEIGSGELKFIGGMVDPASSPLRLTLALQNAESAEISLDFGAVSGLGAGANSTVIVQKQGGRPAGTISAQTFDERGTLKLTYSNGEKADGPKLVLAQIADEAELAQKGSSLFEYRGEQPPVLREAGEDLKVVSGSLERSNVDLTEEFSELILMQRGYQASSQVVSTVNDMLQELLEMRGRR